MNHTREMELRWATLDQNAAAHAAEVARDMQSRGAFEAALWWQRAAQRAYANARDWYSEDYQPHYAAVGRTTK